MSSIDYYRAEMAKALETIALIESGGWRFYESKGNDPMKEVTAERLAEKRQDVKTYDYLIQAWERLDAQGS